MRIAIVDDELNWLKRALGYVRNYFQDKEVCVEAYHSGESFLKQNKQYDIIFVDIEMPGMDGFEVSKEYKNQYPKCILIILTSHTEMSMEGYRVEAFRYIDKQSMRTKIREALSAAEKRLVNQRILTIEAVGIGKIPLRLDSILYVETGKRNLLVHTEKNVYYCKYSMKQMEKWLEGSCFYRCHNAYIVNLDYIETIDSKDAYLTDGSKVLVSDRKRAMLRKKHVARLYETVNA